MSAMDNVIADACRSAAATIRHDGASEPGEIHHVTPALLEVLRVRLGDLVRSEVQILVPGWKPSPGPTDIAIGRGAPYESVIEVKVYKLEWSLWDLVKVASHVRGLTARNGYLVVAATPYKFAKQHDFAEALAGDQTHSTAELFERYEAAWIDLLRGGSGRPHELPARIRTEVIAEAPLSNSPKWRLRAIRVAPPPHGTVAFIGDWPAGHRLSPRTTAVPEGVGTGRRDEPQPEWAGLHAQRWRGVVERATRLVRRLRGRSP